jgi:ATP synthase protein I
VLFFTSGRGHPPPLNHMDEDLKRTIKALGLISTIGIAMALSIGLGAFIGHYLDKKFESQPWFLFIFLGFGIIAAFRNLYILYKKAKNL